MSGESTVVTGEPDEPLEPVGPAVTYRVVAAGDIGNAELKFYKKNPDADVPVPVDPATPATAADVTETNMGEYVVENDRADEANNVTSNDVGKNSSIVTSSEQQAQITDATRKTLNELGLMPGRQGGAGRRRSKRRHPKKGSRKSKKGGARKSKKVGRSRKNGSKRHANKKH